MLERIKRMLIKEFLQIFRDPRMRSILFVVPVFQALIFGYAVTTDVNHISTAVSDHDQTPASRRVIDAFSESGYFQIKKYVKNDAEAGKLLDSGEVLVAFDIDNGFQDSIKAGKTANMQAIIDGTDGNSARIINNYIAKIANETSKKILQEQQLQQMGPTVTHTGLPLESRAWFNENLESRNFYIPGIISTILTLVTLTMTSMSIVREKEVGTMEQILVTPIRKYEFILGKNRPLHTHSLFRCHHHCRCGHPLV